MIAIILSLFSAIVIYNLFMLMLIGIPAMPRLRVVPSEYESIQEAVNEALDGDIIYVKAGTYRENLVINKSIILVGEDSRRTLLDGGMGDYTILIERGGVVITGFTITGGGTIMDIGGRGLDYKSTTHPTFLCFGTTLPATEWRYTPIHPRIYQSSKTSFMATVREYT